MQKWDRFFFLFFPLSRRRKAQAFRLGKKGVRKGWRRLNKKRHLLRSTLRCSLSTRHARPIADGVFLLLEK